MTASARARGPPSAEAVKHLERHLQNSNPQRNNGARADLQPIEASPPAVIAYLKTQRKGAGANPASGWRQHLCGARANIVVAAGLLTLPLLAEMDAMEHKAHHGGGGMMPMQMYFEVQRRASCAGCLVSAPRRHTHGSGGTEKQHSSCFVQTEWSAQRFSQDCACVYVFVSVEMTHATCMGERLVSPHRYSERCTRALKPFRATRNSTAGLCIDARVSPSCVRHDAEPQWFAAHMF